MRPDQVLVSMGGLGLIAAIIYFFFGQKEETAVTGFTNKIIVSGGYRPSVIYINKTGPATLTFKRTDENSCLEEVVFPDYKITKYLPLNEEVTVTLPAPHIEKSVFHCGMNMYHGKIIAK